MPYSEFLYAWPTPELTGGICTETKLDFRRVVRMQHPELKSEVARRRTVRHHIPIPTQAKRH
jgi:hypothetical protein